MKKQVSRLQFRAKLRGDRTIAVPGDIAAALPAGRVLNFSVDPRVGRTPDGHYSEEELERISRLQAEPPEAVRKCLDAQGSLSRSPRFARRASAGGTGRV